MPRAILAALLLTAGCASTAADTPDTVAAAGFPVPAIPSAPKTYRAVRVATPPLLDGRLDDAAWRDAEWTDAFVDIQGGDHPAPRFETRAKIVWDDTHVYFGVEMTEPHLWATYTERDSIIYHENDIEVFLDPDGDTHDYFELEVNVLGTEWDLYLTKPYRDDGRALHEWDAPGLQSVVHARGTINDPRDTDDGWSIEIAWPFASLAAGAGTPCPPRVGDRWRVNFSRVQWHIEPTGAGYAKVRDPKTGDPLPEDNWVWSPQGLIAMHYPEMWGVVLFADASGAPPELSAEDAARAALYDVYYAQRRFFELHERYARTPLELGIASPPRGLSFQTMRSGWEARAPIEDDDLLLREDGRVRRVPRDGGSR